MTVKEAYLDAEKSLLRIYDKTEAAFIAHALLEHVAGIHQRDLLLNPETLWPEEKTAFLNKALEELSQHKPLQQVIGGTWFYNLFFTINKHVLIPRPETEELVEKVINEIEPGFSGNILDIGTGSGCIPVSIKYNIPGSLVTAIDISEQALAVAEENAGKHEVSIEFKKCNFLNDGERDQLGMFDIIVSNPPYIPAGEASAMASHVKDYEPTVALFVSDERPLIFYEKIAAFSADHLLPLGRVYLEVHSSLANAVADLFMQVMFKTEIFKDISGNDRFVKITRYH